MKLLLPFFCVLLLASFAMGEGKVHPWEEKKDNKAHAWAEEKKQASPECKTNVSCQIEGISALEFRRGAMWTKPAYCATCDGTTYNANVRWFLDKGYTIIDTHMIGDTIRVILEHKAR